MIFESFVQDFCSPFMFEIWLGKAMIANQQMNAPMPMAYTQFMQAVDSASRDKRPMKVVCHGTCPIEKLNGDVEEKPAKVIFYNATYESEIGINE